MPTEQEVYQKYADQYERLIRREDYQNNLLSAMEDYCPLNELDVVELGAGTGRLTRLLAPRVRSIQAFDASAHMLVEAERSLHDMGLTNWQIGVADHRYIPAPDACADLVISGWSWSAAGRALGITIALASVTTALAFATLRSRLRRL